MSSSSRLLEITSLSVSYEGAQALCDVSLSLDAGEIVGIVGESGSGKSTLLRAVAHLLPGSARVTSGEVRFEGKAMASMSRRERDSLHGSAISYLFQNAQSSFDPLFTIGKQFDEVMRAHGLMKKADGGRDMQTATLIRMGFDDPERVLASLPSELSGGMCQRVALAFSLAASPRLLLADEPTSALDIDSQERVMRYMAELNNVDELAILLVSHDIELVASVASRIIVMHDGAIVEQGTSQEIMHNPQHPYTQELIAAIPHASGTAQVERLGRRHAACS